jgi:hypothetical protein
VIPVSGMEMENNKLAGFLLRLTKKMAMQNRFLGPVGLGRVKEQLHFEIHNI